MAGLMDLLNSDLGKQIIGNISKKAGINPEQAGAVVANGLPEILARMQQNTSNGDSGLLGALLGGKHDGSILDNIPGYVSGGDTSDGSKILGHVFGDDQSTLTNGLSQKTGVDSSIISKILPMLMPIIMGYLAKQTSSNGVQDTGGLGSILGGLLGGGNNDGNSSLGNTILTSVLDQDGDGKIGIGDAVSAMNGKGKSGGLLGGIFGKLFGSK